PVSDARASRRPAAPDGTGGAGAARVRGGAEGESEPLSHAVRRRARGGDSRRPSEGRELLREGGRALQERRHGAPGADAREGVHRTAVSVRSTRAFLMALAVVAGSLGPAAADPS